MQVEEVTDAHACLPTAEFLSAEELVSLRKPAEETPQLVIGEKLYTRTDAGLEEKALKCALESYKETLDKKRAGRVCDLLQAEWHPELNIVIVPKLKGKFTQHMGHLVNGKYVLAPEEAVFLLENNCLEIMNGKMPMSTEEAFTLILKGNLGLEKYQVYSHLSKLGYVTVLHQTGAGITEYEKEMNLDKNPLKKKRPLKETSEGEPEKKRLTFTGALSEGSEMKTTSAATKENSIAGSERETDPVCPKASLEETKIPEHGTAGESSNTVRNTAHDAEEQNGNGDKGTQIDKINGTSMDKAELEVEPENKNINSSKEKNSPSDSKSVEENGNVTEVHKNESNGVNIENLKELTGNSKLQNDFPSKDNENQDFLDSNSQPSKIVDVMDVDTDAEISCSASEVSRDLFDSNANAASQDSCISVNNDDNTQGDTNLDNNSDVMSMSCSSEEDEVLTIDAASGDHPDDDEVTLLEVTKKETKPLAVIDLLSEDDNDETEAVDVVDDDITVLEEYSSPSMGRPASSKEINSKKLNGCKKEEPGITTPKLTVPSSKLIPPLTVQTPEMYKKRVVCIPRPPLHLLPNHVKPSKEAYVIDFKRNNPDQPASNTRLWSSYREMQDYQRQRRQNRHQNNSPNSMPFAGQGTWNDRNSRNRDRSYRPGFRSDQMNSPDVNSNPRGLLGPPPMDFNSNVFSVNSYPNNLPMSNPTTMNCEVTIKEDNNESLVSSSRQSSHSNNFSFSSGMPNNLLMNPLMAPNSFMAGMQRNTFNLGNNAHTNLMADLQRTCFTVATNMLSSMLNSRNPSLLPNPAMSMFPPGMNPPFNPNMSNGFNSSFNPPAGNEYLSMPPQNFGNQQRRFHRGRPFPCRYRNVGNKRSWSDVKSAVCDSSSDSDIEEMPISPREILWDNKDIVPLVKPGVRYPVGSVFKFLQITQKAKVTYRYGYCSKSLPSVSNLEISFDVYPPGFTYKKTCPQTPKYRIVVVRSTDPIPKYSDIAILQRKWNDGATLLIAVNDNGDISFQSFNSISMPSALLTPHED